MSAHDSHLVMTGIEVVYANRRGTKNPYARSSSRLMSKRALHAPERSNRSAALYFSTEAIRS